MVVNKINANYGIQYEQQAQKASSSTASFADALNNAINHNPQNLDDIFAAAAEKYHVPVNLLKAIAKAESNFNANAVSCAGAQGIMQLMPATARSLGVTNAFDAEQNIMGGAKYISQMLERFDNNTALALAAYNAGPGNVLKYNGIPPFQETQNYVEKVLGYLGENITVGFSNTTNTQNTADTAISDASALMMQGMNVIFSNQEGFNGMGYEMMMSLYKFQVQAKLLANMNTEDIV